jgi:Fe-S cluster assembly ATP-binding protein
MLRLLDYSISINGKKLLDKVNFTINPGEIHALLGPNGSGKSSLLNAIMGKTFDVTGKTFFNDKDITELPPDERSKAGIFMTFQQPIEIEGISNMAVVRESVRERDSTVKIKQILTEFKDNANKLELGQDWHQRLFNLNASGGERKKMEILQMLMLKPKLLLLDEIDSGLDVDALHIIAELIKNYLTSDTACIVVSHNFKLYDYLQPSQVHVIANSKLNTYQPNMLQKIKNEGYNQFT